MYCVASMVEWTVQNEMEDNGLIPLVRWVWLKDLNLEPLYDKKVLHLEILYL